MEVTTSLGESLPQLFGDGVSLQRALINLLDNAVDACKGEGRLEISTLARSTPGNGVSGITIEIADNGAGIPPEVLPKIFDLFVTTKPPGKGTGFGLVICQEIIKAHSGTINVLSQIGRGTSVQIFLPTDTKLGESLVTEASA
jgi:signal transduction histidine kinase